MSAVNYIERYNALAYALPGQNLAWLSKLRQWALGSFTESGFPSPREEEWKYTNFTVLEKRLFGPQNVSSTASVDRDWLKTQKLTDTWSLVLVDGHFVPSVSDLEGLPDEVIATGISEALKNFPDRVKNLLGVALGLEIHGFLAFNTAYFSDGAFVEIASGTILKKPIQILHVSTRNEALANTRSLIGLGANANAKIIETFVGSSSISYLTTAVTEIHLEEKATLDHYKLQVETDKAYHFGGVYVKQEKFSHFNQHNLSFGGLLVRNEIHTYLAMVAECEMNGLFLVKGRQHVDNYTLIHHNEPNGISRETYRGVLADRARGVFQGRIIVHPHAQKTNAEMNNRNLLLSEEAEIDSKPQLEILADDVKCSHGVAIGQLESESVFYLVSRGIDQETAKNMLTFAFANEMLEKIGLESLHGRVQEHLLDMFPQTGIRRDWL